MQEQKIDFKLKDIKQMAGFDKKVYCVRFCDHIPALGNYFAAVGSNILDVYQIHPDTGDIDVIQHHYDEDIDRSNPNQDNSEVFYSCTWASDKYESPLVVAAGKQRILKIINIITLEVAALRGHGDYINELRTHTIDPGLVFSASRDQSIRLWNVRTMSCVAIFGGEKGHRDDVLCVDVHTLGNCFASSSIDTTIKIWNLHEAKLLTNIEKSDAIDTQPEDLRYKVVVIQIPLFSTTSIHTDYIDSIRWIGDCIVSKSTNNRIVLWTPDALRYKGAPLILQEYHMSNSEIWFVKFDVSIPLGVFAVGNSQGKISIYPIVPHLNLDAKSSPTSLDRRERFFNPVACNPIATLSHVKFPHIIRQVAFSPDNRYLICGMEEGILQIWSISYQ